jgi:O-antigen ligase
LGVGLVAYAIGYSAPRLTLIALGLGMAIWQLAVPWVIQAVRIEPDVLHALPTSWEHRIEMWRYAVAHIPEHPVIGWGMDASRTLGRSIYIDGQDVNLLSLHPHNWGLHIWLETGAIGAVLAALTMAIGGFAASRALRFDRAAAAGACGAIASYAVIANLSFGAWQEWWVATGFAAAALVAASVRTTASTLNEDDETP